jgi:hypothetical protein
MCENIAISNAIFLVRLPNLLVFFIKPVNLKNPILAFFIQNTHLSECATKY